MSGKRWPARLKRRPRRLDESKDCYDRTIDRYVVKLQRQHRRRRGKRARHRSRGHADRTEIVGMAIVGMTLVLAAFRGGNRRRYGGNSAAGSLSADGMDVTKGQPKVNRQRDQRQPRTLPDGVPKPAHSSRSVPCRILWNSARSAILAEPQGASIGSPWSHSARIAGKRRQIPRYRCCRSGSAINSGEVPLHTVRPRSMT